MNGHSARTLLPAGLHTSLNTINAALLVGDFDDARLCLPQLQEKLGEPGLEGVRQAANQLDRVLGPAGTTPPAGLGRATVDLTEAVEQLAPS
jgi:hypothetical protein